MEFIIVFALGYCFKDFTSYLKQLVNDINFNKEFKTIIDLDNEWSKDDLP